MRFHLSLENGLGYPAGAFKAGIVLFDELSEDDEVSLLGMHRYS